MRNLNSDWNYFLIFRYKHSQHAGYQCHVNRACNKWLETWDVAIIHTGGTRICVTVQWITVDHMTLSPAKLNLIIPPEQRSCWGGYIGFTPSVCPSVRPSVRLSRLPCPLCNIYSSGWILSILATNDHYHERVCRTQWPLTLTYIFKVIRPWLRKSCPLCNVYSSRWILSMFGTNDHYY